MPLVYQSNELSLDLTCMSHRRPEHLAKTDPMQGMKFYHRVNL